MKISLYRSSSAGAKMAPMILLAIAGTVAAHPAVAQYRRELGNDMRRCSADGGPAVLVTAEGVKSSAGKLRVQLYKATAADWLQKGRWLSRIEVPARAGSVSVCVPVPSAGSYAIAIRHDLNGNGDTDIMADGGGMSNNPSINIFNLGKPSVARTAFQVGNGVKPMRIRIRYM